MNVQDKYTEMTGKLPYKEAALEFEFTDEYVEWLEERVKKLSLGVVVGRSEQCSGCNESTGETKLWCCNHCGKRIEDF